MKYRCRLSADDIRTWTYHKQKMVKEVLWPSQCLQVVMRPENLGALIFDHPVNYHKFKAATDRAWFSWYRNKGRMELDAELKVQVKLLRADVEFYKHCIRSGEYPKRGAEPSAQRQTA